LAILERFKSEKIENTEAFASALALVLVTGDVIGLCGPLGAGKSVFARAVIRTLAGDPELTVCSPTFTLVQEYELPSVMVSHFDLYRLTGMAELREIGLRDAMLNRIVLIEWAERAENILKPSLNIWMEPSDREDDTRIFTVCGDQEARGEQVRGIIEPLKKSGILI